MKTIDKENELVELRLLQRRKVLSERVLSDRLRELYDSGISQGDLAVAIGKSQPQVSRMIREAQGSGGGEASLHAATAMELVRRAERGEIDHQRLVQLLKGWNYDASDRPENLIDDIITVDNSLDAVDAAIDFGLITEDEYYEIMDVAA